MTSGAAGQTFHPMHALICTGGEAPHPDFLNAIAPGFDLTIAADSGLETALRAGIRVDAIVGDMDSLKDENLLEGFPDSCIRRFPVAKDYTDTELAMEYAWERGADAITIAGGGGGRIDHLLAIRALFDRPKPPLAWHAGDESLYRVAEGGEFRMRCGSGARVSVFPLGSEASTGMGSEGLKWPLDGLSWKPGEFGISNLCEHGEFAVRAGGAALLVVVERVSCSGRPGSSSPRREGR